MPKLPDEELQTYLKHGTHPRPEKQVRELNKQQKAVFSDPLKTEYKFYKSVIFVEVSSKIEPEFYEQTLINIYHGMEGKKPDGNVRPLADIERGSSRKKFDSMDKASKQKMYNFVKNLFLN